MDLEAQIDRLNDALLRLTDADGRPQAADPRLAQLTEQCADLLRQWTATSERHAHAVGELETRLTDWNDIEGRLQRDVTWRFRELERLIEHEWASLRRLHEEPARQLREHAENLTEICVTTAGSAQTGIERSEARLDKLEKDLHRRMDDLSRDFHTVVSELREQSRAALRGPAGSWSLDAVTRLHQEIRDSAGGDPNPPLTGRLALGSSAPPAALGARAGTVLDVDNGRSAEATDPAPAGRSRSLSYGIVTAMLVLTALAGGLAWTFDNNAKLASEQAAQAQHRAELLAAAAGERIEAARHDAATQIAAARDTASKAQITSDVLAAPDLIRFGLAGDAGGTRTSAQVLWSRSRGLVVSGSRLPPPPAGMIYQIWLLTTADAISAGTMMPDDAGRVTVATDRPPNPPRPVIGVRVTLEPAPGREAPTGTTVLTRVQ